WFLLSFRYFVWKCEVYVWIVYAVILYVYSFWFAGLGAGAPEGRAYKSERRADGARKKRCAIPLTRSKELFQPDARSDFLLLGPGLRPGRCGRVGSPEGVGRGSRNTLPPPLAQRSDKPNKKRPFPGAPCVCIFFVKKNVIPAPALRRYTSPAGSSRCRTGRIPRWSSRKSRTAPPGQYRCGPPAGRGRPAGRPARPAGCRPGRPDRKSVV